MTIPLDVGADAGAVERHADVACSAGNRVQLGTAGQRGRCGPRRTIEEERLSRLIDRPAEAQADTGDLAEPGAINRRSFRPARSVEADHAAGGVRGEAESGRGTRHGHEAVVHPGPRVDRRRSRPDAAVVADRHAATDRDAQRTRRTGHGRERAHAADRHRRRPAPARCGSLRGARPHPVARSRRERQDAQHAHERDPGGDCCEHTRHGATLRRRHVHRRHPEYYRYALRRTLGGSAARINNTRPTRPCEPQACQRHGDARGAEHSSNRHPRHAAPHSWASASICGRPGARRLRSARAGDQGARGGPDHSPAAWRLARDRVLRRRGGGSPRDHAGADRTRDARHHDLRCGADRPVRRQRALPPVAAAQPRQTRPAADRPQHDLRVHRGKLHADRAARPPRAARLGRARDRLDRSGRRRDLLARLDPSVPPGPGAQLCGARMGCAARHAAAAQPAVARATVPACRRRAALLRRRGGVCATAAGPWPRTFGFHEVFHVLVILAAAAQYIALVGWVLPAAGT